MTEQLLVQTAAPAGWYPVAEGRRYWDGAQWSPVGSGPVPAGDDLVAHRTATRIGTLQVFSGLGWFVIGLLLFFTFTNPVLGLMNMILGALRLGNVEPLNARSKRVLASFEGKAGLIIIGIVTALGAVLGILNGGFDGLLCAAGMFVLALDVVIRGRVVGNRQIFNR